MKKIALALHLWTGLLFGTILVVLGLTGSALSWIHELDAWLNPGLLHVAPQPGLRAGQALRAEPALVEAVSGMLARDPRYGRPSLLELPERSGDVFVAWYRKEAPKGQAPWVQSASRQVMVDPATLAVTGERNWGQFGLSRPLLMPTLFHVHRYLVAGETGKVLVAITGVSLALLILTGMVLWFPRLTRSALWHAVTVRHGGNWPRFSFQLHRAGGLFAAPVLLVIAVSGIHFNMPAWVTPLVHAVAPVTQHGKLANRSARGSDPIPLSQALLQAQALFPEGRVSRVSLPSGPGQPFEIRVRQPGELRQGSGATRISIDSGNGSVLRVIDPERARGGDRFLSWLFPLHTGEAFGLAGRIVISLFGVVPLIFFVTGLVVWVRLRRMHPGFGATRRTGGAVPRMAAVAAR